MIRLKSGGLYCGAAQNREKRYKDHFAGKGCRTTNQDPPIAVAYEEEFSSYKEAYKREQQIKSWARAKMIIF
jgi:putative endonuclease